MIIACNAGDNKYINGGYINDLQGKFYKIHGRLWRIDIW